MQVPRLHPTPMQSEPLESANSTELPSTDSAAGPFRKKGITGAPRSSLGWRWGERDEDCDSVPANCHKSLELIFVFRDPSHEDRGTASLPHPAPLHHLAFLLFLPPSSFPISPAGLEAALALSQPLPASPRPPISSSTGFKFLLQPHPPDKGVNSLPPLCPTHQHANGFYKTNVSSISSRALYIIPN